LHLYWSFARMSGYVYDTQCKYLTH
jgi:hypothetical protein